MWHPATAAFKYCEAFASVSILILHSCLCTLFHPPLTKTIQDKEKKSKTTFLIELKQQQKKTDSKKRHCPFNSKDVAFCCLADLSPFVFLLSPPCSPSLLVTSLPAVFNGWVDLREREREEKRARVSETARQTGKKRRMRRMRMEGREGSHLQARL